MLGYICKYAPIEIFESMGVTMQRIEPDVTNFNQAEIKMHPNICSFAKGVLEDVMAGDYEGVILTTCCDSIRRLYDVLKEEFPEKFIYMLDTPRITKEAGITLYEQRIRVMIQEYEKFSGKKFQEDKFLEYLKERKTAFVRDLAAALYVSEATVRRDLNEMQKLGLIERSHGGAILPENAEEVSIHWRNDRKAGIGKNMQQTSRCVIAWYL